MEWQHEVERLHRFFEQWFNGACAKGELRVLEAALTDEFSMITPSGDLLGRSEVVRRIADAYGGRPGLVIAVRGFATILGDPGVLAGRYVERQEEDGEVTERVSLAIFDRSGPDGSLRWVTVHETWRAAG